MTRKTITTYKPKHSDNLFIPTNFDLDVIGCIRVMCATRELDMTAISQLTNIDIEILQQYMQMTRPMIISHLYKIAGVLGVPAFALNNHPFSNFCHDDDVFAMVDRIYSLSKNDRQMVHQLITRLCSGGPTANAQWPHPRMR